MKTETLTAVTEYYVTIVTANFRNVDGCDSDAAVEAIYEAGKAAAEQFATDNDISITVQEPEFPHDQQARTIIVGWDVPDDLADEGYEAARAAMKMAEDIEYEVGRAIDRAIEDGDWER